MIDQIRPLIIKFTSFAKDNLNFKKPPKLFLKRDSENSNCALGKTAHYDPQQSSVTVYITGRHPKDIIRSFAHELVHHCQNERGDLAPEKMKTLTKNYAQENDHMRNMEKEAYLLGNMCFRDWEDSLDDKLQYKMKLAEQKFLKENKNMSVKISKKDLKGLISNLLEKKMKQVKENGCGGKGKKEDDSTPPKKPGEDCCGQENCGHKVEESQEFSAEYDDEFTDGRKNLPDPLQKAILDKKGKTKEKSKNEGKDPGELPYTEKEIKAAMDAGKTTPSAIASHLRKGKASALQHEREVRLLRPIVAKLKKAERDGEVNEQFDNDGDGDIDGLGPGHFFKSYSPEQRAKFEACVEVTRTLMPEIPPSSPGAVDGRDPAHMKCSEMFPADLDDPRQPKGEGPELYEDKKITTPEGEKKLYEDRFNRRNTKLFKKLLKEWTK